MKHTYYRTCERCGANLDPGEKCGCADRKDYLFFRPDRIDTNEAINTAKMRKKERKWEYGREAV